MQQVACKIVESCLANVEQGWPNNNYVAPANLPTCTCCIYLQTVVHGRASLTIPVYFSPLKPTVS